MFPRLARAHRPRHKRSELAGGLKRALLPSRDDGPGDAPCESFLTQCCDHFSNLVDARAIEPGRDRFAASRIHAHVERTFRAEGEAALRRIELWRRDTQVEEHAAAWPSLRMCRHERTKV